MNKNAYHGLPTYLRASIIQASQRWHNGSYRQDYSDVGAQVAMHLPNYAEWDAIEYLQKPDTCLALGEMAQWLSRSVPRVWKAIPPRRRMKFAEGFLTTCHNEGWKW